MTLAILNTNAVLTMTSREIADLTGKQHQHVRRDVKNMLTACKDKSWAETQNWSNSCGVSHEEYVISNHYANLILEKYRGFARVPNRLQEEASLKTIEQILGIRLIRQFCVLSYRIDGYCVETNTAYEIDEPAHQSKTKKDATRQQEIESAIGCKFVRISL